MLAMGRRVSACWRASTSPVAPFSTKYAFAATGGGPALADETTTSAAATATSARPIRSLRLPHAYALADLESRRVQAGVQLEQLLDGRSEERRVGKEGRARRRAEGSRE